MNDSRYVALTLSPEIPMNDKQKSDYLLGGLLLLVAGRSGNWLITPMSHPGAGTLEYVLTWAQVIVCVAAGFRLLRRSRVPVSAS